VLLADTMAKASPALDDEEDLEFVCPICYLYLCEPIKTPCKHLFCKNCLIKSFGFNRPPRCPLCRTDCTHVKVLELKTHSETEDIVKKLDPEYKERASKCIRERKMWMSSKFLAPLFQNMESGLYEVSGAGNDEVNGIYVVGHVPSYLGPRLYNKPGTQIFMFRWNRREWIIASLARGFDDLRARHYRVSCSLIPEDTPPEDGWMEAPEGLGTAPAPSVRAIRQGDRISPRLLQPLIQDSVISEGSHRCAPCSIM